MTEKHLDCTALACPMPIVRITQAMKELNPGDLLIVTATDPAFQDDLDAWLSSYNYNLVSFQKGKPQKAIIQKQ